MPCTTPFDDLNGMAPVPPAAQANASVKSISPGRDIPRQQRYGQRQRRTLTARARDLRYVTLTYKGGEQNIVIPPTAPVVAFVPGAASIATSGRAGLRALRATTNGKIIAGLVAVGSRPAILAEDR